MKVSIIGGTGPQGLGIGKRLAIEGVDIIIGSLTQIGRASCRERV